MIHCFKIHYIKQPTYGSYRRLQTWFVTPFARSLKHRPITKMLNVTIVTLIYNQLTWRMIHYWRLSEIATWLSLVQAARPQTSPFIWISPQTKIQVSLLSCPRACHCMSQRMQAFYAIKQPCHVHVKRDTVVMKTSKFARYNNEDYPNLYFLNKHVVLQTAVGAPTHILAVKPLAFPLGHTFTFTISPRTSWP